MRKTEKSSCAILKGNKGNGDISDRYDLIGHVGTGEQSPKLIGSKLHVLGSLRFHVLHENFAVFLRSAKRGLALNNIVWWICVGHKSIRKNLVRSGLIERVSLAAFPKLDTRSQ